MSETASRRITRTVAVDGTEHTYQCSVPVAGADEGDEQLPVVVALHGKGDNGHDFLIGTNLGIAKAIVVAPTGSGLAWSPAPYAITTVAEDTALIEAIVDDVANFSNADTRRIYLAGFSNGGGFAAVLAVNDPARYAGVATVAGAVRVDPSLLQAGAPIDYLNIHGTWDDVVPYEGQPGGVLGQIMGAEEVTAGFAARNQGGARAEHIRVEGMGHEWPAGPWARSRGIDVTETVLGFFGIETLHGDGA